VETEDDRLARNMDRGELSKKKNIFLDSLEDRVRRKERQVGEARKTWVNLT
jgi:hypothetical protein